MKIRDEMRGLLCSLIHFLCICFFNTRVLPRKQDDSGKTVSDALIIKKYTLQYIFLARGYFGFFFCFHFGICGGEHKRVMSLALHCILFLAISSSRVSCFLLDIIK